MDSIKGMEDSEYRAMIEAKLAKKGSIRIESSEEKIAALEGSLIDKGVILAPQVASESIRPQVVPQEKSIPSTEDLLLAFLDENKPVGIFKAKPLFIEFKEKLQKIGIFNLGQLIKSLSALEEKGIIQKSPSRQLRFQKVKN